MVIKQRPLPSDIQGPPSTIASSTPKEPSRSDPTRQQASPHIQAPNEVFALKW